MHGLYKLNAVLYFFIQPINLLNTISPKYGVIENQKMHNTNSIVLATADILCMVKTIFPDILLRYIAIKLGFISI